MKRNSRQRKDSGNASNDLQQMYDRLVSNADGNGESYSELRALRPVGDWPGRHVIDLDDCGDAGAFLDQALPPVETELLSEQVDIDAIALDLSKEFVAFCNDHANGFVPLQCHVVEAESINDEKTYDDLKAEFIGFLQEWRRRVIEYLETKRGDPTAIGILPTPPRSFEPPSST